MKRTTAIIAGAALAVAALAGLNLFAKTMTSQQSKDKEGHVLTALWKEYKAAENADRPLLQTEILERIKTQAKERQLPWDFWDAATSSVQVQGSRNWKLRDSLNKALKEESMAFPDPVVGFTYLYHYKSLSEMLKFARENIGKLKGNRNEAFYKNDSRVGQQLSKKLPDYIKNDYEYALWNIALSSSYNERNAATDSLRSILDGRYPAAPYLEYKVAERLTSGSGAWKKGMQKVVDNYPGKAITLYPLAAVTYQRLWDLQRDKKSVQQDYKAIRVDIAAFETQRKNYTGSEAALVAELKSFKHMLEELDSKNLTLEVTPEKATVGFRNIKSGWLTMVNEDKPDKVLFRQQLKNTSGRYYIYDTLVVTLPDLGDGVYKVSIGSNELKEEGIVTGKFQRYSYALSVRRSADGFGFFATNAATGMPLEKVELVAKDDDDKERSVTVRQGSAAYTPVPKIKGIEDLEDCEEFFVRWKDASGFVRMSPSTDLMILDLDRGYDSYNGRIYLNVAAFHPGEVIKFKGLIFKTLADSSLSLDKPGSAAEVTISDPSGKEYFKEKFDVSEMGSLAGEFTLPQEAKTGYWEIDIRYAGRHVASRNFYYGDFVPPSFTCTFEPFENAYFPGDTVHVRGRLESFSGHKLSEARVEYIVKKYNRVVATDVIKPEADGSFDFAFVSEREYYDILLTVADATGETLGFETYLHVYDYMRIDGSLKNDAGDYKASLPVVTDSKARFMVGVTNESLPVAGARFKYELHGPYDAVVLEGEKLAGSEFELDLAGLPDGCYKLEFQSLLKNPNGRAPEDDVSFIKYTPGAVIPGDVKELFWHGPGKVAEGEDIEFCLGSGTHPVWAAVELYSPTRKVLWAKTVFIAKGSFDKVAVPYNKDFADDVCVGLVFFNDYEGFEYDAHYYIVRADSSLPLVVKSFQDEARPGTEVTVELETRPGAEAVASVWDKASDAIYRNRWDKVYVREVLAGFAPHLNAVRRPGREYDFIAYGRMDAGVMLEAAAPAPVMEKSSDSLEEVVLMRNSVSEGVRSDFSGALAFEPFLKADADGILRFSFMTSDKLSTFRMAVFAHDSKVRNNLVEKEFKVTVPVKVDVLKPEYLVEGDSFTLTATVSSNVDKEMLGKLVVYRYDGDDYKALKPVAVLSADVSVPASGVATHQFDLSPVMLSEVETSPSLQPVGLLVSFQADDGTSDAMFFAVPVLERAQTLTEAHSAVLLAGADKDALMKDLEGRFTGTSHYGAVASEITVLDMVKEVLESKLEEPGNDVLSLTEALYVRSVLNSLVGRGKPLSPVTASASSGSSHVMLSEAETSLLQRILALQNADGGFAWFKGFGSSPMLTAVVLERFCKMTAAVTLSEVEGSLSKAVKYLDSNHFAADVPYWRGGISDAQYMYIRALYADVAFDVPKEKTAAKKFADFKKDAEEYLVPEKVRGLNANIMGKARRLNTLRVLLSSDAGKGLAALWGIKTSAKMESSMAADVTSLLEYAVRHKDGGWYYPNAVMPWRGLLETEAYAHVQLANLLSPVMLSAAETSPSPAAVADGIRLWLMLQKETQHWDLTPHFVDAVACILEGSREVLDTKVLTLAKTYRKPLEEIVAAGNGFTIKREFFREVVKTGGKTDVEPIWPGDSVQKGDKIIAVYYVYNAENRSFVRLRAPREATLRPVDQLSGYNWRYYKEVRTSWTDYYFDSMPEERSEIHEEFFVTQTGTFACGVPEIESLYANHYRANDAFRGPLHAK